MTAKSNKEEQKEGKEKSFNFDFSSTHVRVVMKIPFKRAKEIQPTLNKIKGDFPDIEMTAALKS